MSPGRGGAGRSTQGARRFRPRPWQWARTGPGAGASANGWAFNQSTNGCCGEARGLSAGGRWYPSVSGRAHRRESRHRASARRLPTRTGVSTGVTVPIGNHGRYPDRLDRNWATGCENRHLLPLSLRLKIPRSARGVRVRLSVPAAFLSDASIIYRFRYAIQLSSSCFAHQQILWPVRRDRLDRRCRGTRYPASTCPALPTSMS